MSICQVDQFLPPKIQAFNVRCANIWCSIVQQHITFECFQVTSNCRAAFVSHNIRLEAYDSRDRPNGSKVHGNNQAVLGHRLGGDLGPRPRRRAKIEADFALFKESIPPIELYQFESSSRPKPFLTSEVIKLIKSSFTVLQFLAFLLQYRSGAYPFLDRHDGSNRRLVASKISREVGGGVESDSPNHGDNTLGKFKFARAPTVCLRSTTYSVPAKPFRSYLAPIVIYMQLINEPHCVRSVPISHTFT